MPRGAATKAAAVLEETPLVQHMRTVGGGHRRSAGRDGGSKGLKRRLVFKHDIALMLVRTMSTEVTTIESLENILLERELELRWDVFE
jgi:hypothetical protein